MVGIHKCLVLEQRESKGTLGKHEAHPPHLWWYTSWGGGHQMFDGFHPDTHPEDAKMEKNLREWQCPGRDS